MKEQLITFETAKLAKEKNFPHINRGLNNMYTSEGRLYNSVGVTFDEQNSFQAPPQSLLLKWLREKYFIDVVVEPDFDKNFYDWYIYDQNKSNKIRESGETYISYEEALEKGLQEALKGVK